jgi:hypothetical protein
MPKGIYPHPKHSPIQKIRIGVSVSALWETKRKGKTYEEIFGIETATAMKAKMRLAKLGRKMPWNSVPSRKGKAHPRWIKDRTKVKLDKERGGPLHKQWSRAIKNRDNWICRLADKNCSGRLTSHHIYTWHDYPQLRYKLNNGIALCHAHHPRSRAEERRLIPYFKKLLDS